MSQLVYKDNLCHIFISGLHYEPFFYINLKCWILGIVSWLHVIHSYVPGIIYGHVMHYWGPASKQFATKCYHIDFLQKWYDFVSYKGIYEYALYYHMNLWVITYEFVLSKFNLMWILLVWYEVYEHFLLSGIPLWGVCSMITLYTHISEFLAMFGWS